MAGFKETPRQKMIGMMYLVLTALLALNVSKEILDAFVIVNDSVEKTSINFTDKVNNLHDEFAQQFINNPEKVKPFYDKAVIAKELSQELVMYIDSLKFSLVALTDGISYDTAKIRPLSEVQGKDKYSEPTHILIGNELLKDGEAYKLENKIDKYREDMLNLIPEMERSGLNIGLETVGGKNASGTPQDWVNYNFYHTILAADVTIFNKLVNEVRNAEYDVVNHLIQGITKTDFKFTSVEARILPKSSYVFQGDSYDAEIFLAALDPTSQPTVDYKMDVTEWHDDFVNSAKFLQGDSGIVRMSLSTNGMTPKEYTFAGRIGVKKSDGSTDYRYFKSSFIVAEPSANVAATKMNVFYRGVENPISISAAGVPVSQLDYSVEGDGRITKTSEGLFVTNLTSKAVQKVTVNVFQTVDGNRKKLGSQEFRVKDLPGPNILVRNMENGVVPRQSLLANPYLLCELPEYVNFEYKYKVVRFTLSIVRNGDNFDKQSSDAYLTADMKDYISSARKNTMLVFSNIQVQGPIDKMSVPNFAVKLN